MLVDDRLGAPVRVARAHRVGGRAVASVNLVGRYALRGGRLELERWADDGPLASTVHRPLWMGTSVCASGVVPGPVRPPHVRRVSLRVGEVTLALTVSGPRRWERSRGGPLVASMPEAFESVPMELASAYGGRVPLQPGIVPGTDLPHPGGTVIHPANPDGTGFVVTEAAAEGAPLPAIEWLGAEVSSWRDRPDPATLAPCPEGNLLRIDARTSLSPVDRVMQALRTFHPGHGRCIAAEVLPGAAIELTGMGAVPARFEVPAPPFAVVVRRRGVDRFVRPRVRAIVVATETDLVDVAWGAGFSWSADTSAGCVRVQRAA